MFSGVPSSMLHTPSICDMWFVWNFKMAAVKPEVLLILAVFEIDLNLECAESNWPPPKTWSIPLEFQFYLNYSQSYNYFRFYGRHLEVPDKPTIVEAGAIQKRKVQTRKHGFSRQNFVPISYTA
jgi:hypothetical protein